MLLNNVRPDDDDRFYFLYRFAVRSWLLFLAVIFSYPAVGFCGRSLAVGQFITLCASFILVLSLDFLSVWIKAYPIYKEQERIEWENWGYKKSR